jgi:hypothetical protein
MQIRGMIPNAEGLLSPETEELAGDLLMHLNSGGALHHYNFFNHLREHPVYDGHYPHRNENGGLGLVMQ